MPLLLEGRRALITGAGRGIGVEIARALAGEGAAVTLAYHSSRDGAERVVDEIREGGGVAFAVGGDAGVEADAVCVVAESVSFMGGLDIVVNNAAGFGPLLPFTEMAWGEIDAEWNAVVRPVYEITRAALPVLLAQGFGKIVNIAASLVERPAPGYGAHTMAKAAVLAFTQTLAREVGPRGITVNAVSPGVTMTEFSKTLPEELKASLIRQTPLRRLAEPVDVARAVLFFCSPWSDFVTGAHLIPDGGLITL